MSVAQEIIAAAVVGGDAVLADGIAVFLRGVALVGAPVVLGIFLCQAVHVVITIGLGEDAGGSDSEVFAVALDNRRMGKSLPPSSSKKRGRILLKRLPSTMMASGRTFNWSSARCMASIEALRILILSISSGVTMPTAQATASRSMIERNS